ncbi:zinc finger protein Dzip1 [Aricia agestis]|uniref:zinc finger protein Dzip1 n=1 Tax=Aricia agestis TaxID=91739 RepID=UPI001C2065C5|nr:zinc finger protein Dzip1 [Aricia agestis]
MACKTSFELHHNFPKLAEEAGFTFNTHRPRVHIQWNKIKLIDIESLVRNRNFNIVEQHLNDILDCVIDLEFDVRILDEGFLKIFRLAQLAVEYQQFCRHYLDRSVFVLKEEITNLLQELDATKKSLKEKEEEIRRMKRKVKHPTRNHLPYGNDNIAKMIINALSQNKTELYQTSPLIDTINYNKCDYCDKAFLNQLYLQSHISRRHGDIVEVPQKETETKMSGDTLITNEIIDLKTKLKEMEELIINSKTKTGENNTDIATCNEDNIIQNIPVKVVKDAEVWTNDDIISPTEQNIRTSEQESYAKEIHLLRAQILDLIKDSHADKHSENETLEQLNATIKSQGDEILALKQELQKENARDKEDRNKIETQLKYWCEKAESQDKDLKALLQKLNNVESQAREYRAKAETEREKSGKFENLLQQHLSRQPVKSNSPTHKSATISDEREYRQKNAELKKISTSAVEQIVLKKLQERAQELLNIDQISSETSTISDFNPQSHEKNSNYNKKGEIVSNISNKSGRNTNSDLNLNKQKRKNDKKPKNVSKSKGKLSDTRKDSFISPGSPIKVVRAKLTEEVNNRLASLGIDPLKNKLPKTTYQKQRTRLQEQREMKIKKYPVREKVLHSVIAQLDMKATNSYRNNIENNVVSPNKISRAFSLSSVLSNVKTKALSIVKSNEKLDSPKKSYKYIAKKATALIKSSPEITRLSKSNDEINRDKSNVISKMSSEDEESNESKIKTKPTSSKKLKKIVVSNGHNDSDSSDRDLMDSDKLIPTNKNILNIIKLPVRKPYESPIKIEKSDNIAQNQPEIIINNGRHDDSSDGIESLVEFPPRKALSEDNISSVKQTKGVLKNATSTSSLNKKKVIFDMDAIQMKSVSASPSQSTTEKSDNNETYELGITNLDTEEWDLSSIENLVLPEIAKEEPIPNTSRHQSSKFTELKETIENKLLGRNQTLSTAPIGGVDVLSVPLQRGTNRGGSNTSLGSSILDDTDT